MLFTLTLEYCYRALLHRSPDSSMHSEHGHISHSQVRPHCHTRWSHSWDPCFDTRALPRVFPSRMQPRFGLSMHGTTPATYSWQHSPPATTDTPSCSRCCRHPAGVTALSFHRHDDVNHASKHFGTYRAKRACLEVDACPGQSTQVCVSAQNNRQVVSVLSPDHNLRLFWLGL
jgi:hypothetical protein